MGWLSTQWKKLTGEYYWERFRNERWNNMSAVNIEYGLGFDYYDFKPSANALADAKYAGTLYKAKGWQKIVRVGSYVVSATLTAGAIGAAIASGGTLATVSLAVLAVTTSIASFYAGEVLIPKSVKEKAEAEFDKLKSSAVKSTTDLKSNAAKAKAQLTQTIIWTKYDVYATGAIFSSGKAGDLNTFSASIAYDANKGMLGEIPPSSATKIDDMIWGRAHTNKAGNSAYMQATLEAQIPIKSNIKQDYEQANQTLHRQLVDKEVRFNEGFNKLLYWGYGADGSDINSIYKKKYEAFTSDLHTKIRVNKDLQRLDTYKDGRISLEFYRPKWITKEEQVQANIKQSKGLNDFARWSEYLKAFDGDEYSIDEIFEACVEFQRIRARVFFTMEFQRVAIKGWGLFLAPINGEPFAQITAFKLKELAEKENLTFDELELLDKFIYFYFNETRFNHKLLDSAIQVASIRCGLYLDGGGATSLLYYKYPQELNANDKTEIDAFFTTKFWHPKLDGVLDELDTSLELYDLIENLSAKTLPL